MGNFTEASPVYERVQLEFTSNNQLRRMIADVAIRTTFTIQIVNENELVLHYILIEYPDHKSRSIDIFFSFLVYAVLLIAMLLVFKREFKKQKRRAINSDKLKSAFLANMSHEIRTPMNGIIGFTDFGQRMLNIINDIIDVSKIESGAVSVDLTQSNINKQLEYIYRFFKPEVEAKGMRLIYKNIAISDQIIITTDREKVFSIFTNLLKNAIKYSETGEIEFGYDKTRSGISFFVKDTGIGIAKNRQKAIFRRFVQANIEDSHARQGAGLGLAIAKSYVELLGGEISMESELGRGSKFSFTLPYNPEPLEKQIALPLDEITTKQTDLKILIVEDDEISEVLISIIIQDFCKAPLIARTGIEAVQIARDNPDIDLILMDMQLPLMSGNKATDEIRRFNKDVVIIAQTAYGLSGDREKSIASGCNDYIPKPVKNTDLIRLIEKYL
ncbi:Autoinducer 2 sensor kinase/phosphatase LuxQ [Nymphon striatum]|nr:Autoinducer 2 sensor kinase/phosphatase LuxQ [Nymphon striatum]